MLSMISMIHVQKEPPGDDISKPWKKKGAIRKKPEHDEGEGMLILIHT